MENYKKNIHMLCKQSLEDIKWHAAGVLRHVSPAGCLPGARRLPAERRAVSCANTWRRIPLEEFEY